MTAFCNMTHEQKMAWNKDMPTETCKSVPIDPYNLRPVAWIFLQDTPMIKQRKGQEGLGF